MDFVGVLQNLQNVDSFKQRVFKITTNNTIDKTIMAIDFGTKKIGIAVSDKSGLIAFPKDILIGNWNDADTVIETTIKQINIHHPIAIIFGLPKRLDGTLHENCNIIIPVAEQINKIVPVLLLDERFTTKFAIRNVYDKKKLSCNNKNKHKKCDNCDDDDVAATIILNEALNLLQQ